MPKWLWIGLLGVVLLAPGAAYWAWIWISNPVRPSDAAGAFQRLATVPLSEAERDNGVEVTATMPNSASWRRIIRNWGDPGYFIGAVAPGTSHYLYCLKNLGVHVEAKIGNQPLELETADVPYGYSIDCRPAGLLFRAPPGAVVQIHLAVAGRPGQTADLIVEPHWTVGTKDRLVGIGIEEQLHLRAVATALAIAGIIAISIAAFLFTHRPLSASRVKGD
jgi:hypothetical protein